MKQYIMGMITGASLILCAVMFIGASDNNSNYGKYQAFTKDGKMHLLNTGNGQLYKTEKGILGKKWIRISTKGDLLFTG